MINSAQRCCPCDCAHLCVWSVGLLEFAPKRQSETYTPTTAATAAAAAGAAAGVASHEPPVTTCRFWACLHVAVGGELL